MADHPFTDPVTGQVVTLRVDQGTAGVQHPGCPELADVTPELDAFYCPACQRSGRVSGAWAAMLLARPPAPPPVRPAVPLVLMVGCAVADAAGIAAAVNTGRWGFLALHLVGTTAIAALLVLTRRRTGRW